MVVEGWREGVGLVERKGKVETGDNRVGHIGVLLAWAQQVVQAEGENGGVRESGKTRFKISMECVSSSKRSVVSEWCSRRLQDDADRVCGCLRKRLEHMLWHLSSCDHSTSAFILQGIGWFVGPAYSRNAPVLVQRIGHNVRFARKPHRRAQNQGFLLCTSLGPWGLQNLFSVPLKIHPRLSGIIFWPRFWAQNGTPIFVLPNFASLGNVLSAHELVVP